MDAIKIDESLRVASKFNGIFRTFLSNQVNDESQGRKKGIHVVLNLEEKQALEMYMIDMADYRHLLTTEQLKLKVALLMQKKPTMSTNGIIGNSWLLWFQK